MKKQVLQFAVVLAVLITSKSWGEYSFGQWAVDTGLSTSATVVVADDAGITTLDGLTNYPNLEELVLRGNPISRIEADDFTGMHIWDMRLDRCTYTTIETGAFAGMETLYRIYLTENSVLENKLLNLRGAQFRDLTFFATNSLNITTADLSYSVLSQIAFDGIMNGGGSSLEGLARGAISGINFSGANLSGVIDYDRMYGMSGLQTMNISNVTYAPSIVANNYQEVVELVNALEQQGILSFLTIDDSLYTTRQSYFDDWDAQPLNELTIVPEPTTCLLLGTGLLFLRRRKN